MTEVMDRFPQPHVRFTLFWRHPITEYHRWQPEVPELLGDLVWRGIHVNPDVCLHLTRRLGWRSAQGCGVV